MESLSKSLAMHWRTTHTIPIGWLSGLISVFDRRMCDFVFFFVCVSYKRLEKMVLNKGIKTEYYAPISISPGGGD